MAKEQLISENDLARLAKQFRENAGKTRAQAAREMEVAQTTIFQAEEKPEQALLKLRMRMIDAYSPFKVVGPAFFLVKKPAQRKQGENSNITNKHKTCH